MRLTRPVLTTIALVLAVSSAPSSSDAQLNERLFPIQWCWFQMWSRDNYIMENPSANGTLSTVEFSGPDAGIRLTNNSNGRKFLFCPFMSDDQLSHTDARTVRLQGFATGEAEITAWVCVDAHLGLSTSCTLPVTDIPSPPGVIDFPVHARTMDGGGWFDEVHAEDRTSWYPFIVYEVSGSSAVHLAGYRVEREGA